MTKRDLVRIAYQDLTMESRVHGRYKRNRVEMHGHLPALWEMRQVLANEYWGYTMEDLLRMRRKDVEMAFLAAEEEFQTIEPW